MESTTTFKSVLLDVLTGFLALYPLMLICVMAISLLPRIQTWDVRRVEVASGVLFFLVGLLRGKSGPRNLWLKGLVVISGGSAGLILALGYVSDLNYCAVVILFLVLLVASAPLAVAGIATRRLRALNL